MRIARISLTLVFVTFVSLFAAATLSQRSIGGSRLADATLARALGTNGGQMGGANSSIYSCDDVNAGAGQFSNASCDAATTVPNNSVCVRCSDVSGSGYRAGNATPIVFSQVINCTGKMQTGQCVYETYLGHGYCSADTPNGTCKGSFNQFNAQVQQGNPGGS